MSEYSRQVAAATVVVVALTAFAAVEINGLYSSVSHTTSTPNSSFTGTSQSSTTVGETIFVHVVNSTSGEPITDAAVLAGPASSATGIFAILSSATSYSGYTVNECVHEVPSGSTIVPGGNMAVSNSTTTTFSTCPLKNYNTNATGWVTISNQNATYFFIQAYAQQQASSPNAHVVTIEGSQTYVTAPYPEGNFTVSQHG